MARITQFLGSRVYPFCLDAPGVAELESLTGFGLWHLQARLEARTCTAKEVQAVFRLGLTGAGIGEQEALQRMAEHVVIGRLEAARLTALLVVSDAIDGIAEAESDVEPDPPGKPGEADAASSEASITAASTGRQSSAPLAPKASRPRRSRAPK